MPIAAAEAETLTNENGIRRYMKAVVKFRERLLVVTHVAGGWTYVGISARTAVSVSHQYLTVVLTNGRHPRYVRSDHGTETVLIAGAHHELHQAHDPDMEGATRRP